MVSNGTIGAQAARPNANTALSLADIAGAINVEHRAGHGRRCVELTEFDDCRDFFGIGDFA